MHCTPIRRKALVTSLVIVCRHIREKKNGVTPDLVQARNVTPREVGIGEPVPAPDQMIPNDFVTLYLLSHFSRGAKLERLSAPPIEHIPLPQGRGRGIHNYIIINCNDIYERPAIFACPPGSGRFYGLAFVLIEVAYDRPKRASS